jgi:hypothetical protein
MPEHAVTDTDPKSMPEDFWAAADRIVAPTRLANDRLTHRAARVATPVLLSLLFLLALPNLLGSWKVDGAEQRSKRMLHHPREGCKKGHTRISLPNAANTSAETITTIVVRGCQRMPAGDRR